MSEQKHHLLPLFQKNEVLFGHDGATGLIACEIAGNDSVKLFARDDAATKIDTVSFQPLMLLARRRLKNSPAAAPYRLALFANLTQMSSITRRS